MNDSKVIKTIKSESSRFLLYFSGFGSLILGTYGVINLYIKDYPAAYFEIFLALLLLIGVVILKKTKDSYVPEILGSVTLVAIMYHNFFSGGFEGSGLFWLFLFSPFIFFIKGRKEGSKWLGVFYMMILLTISYHGITRTGVLPYTIVELITFLIVFISVSIFIFVYQSTQERILGNLEDEREKMNAINQSLESYVMKERRNEVDKTKLLSDVQEKNKTLEKNKKIMISILEDVEVEKNNIQIQKDRLSLILESIVDGVLVLDKDLKVINLNRSFSELTGYSLFDLRDENYGKFVKVYEAEKLGNESTFIKDTSATLKPYTPGSTAVIQDINGDLIPITASANPIIAKATDDFQGIVVVFRDARKEREVDKMKNEFISVASHQLKTPLTGASWSLELLEAEETGKLNKKQKELVEELKKTQKQMTDLVNELLNVSRIDRGEKFDIIKNLEDIIPIVKESILDLEAQREMKNIKINLTHSDDEIVANFDSKKIRESVKNLVSNAIKYSIDGSEVEVRINKKDDFIIIEVEDHGIGIPKEQQEKIFTKFYRASNAKEQDIGGTGLGLYICKAVAEGHRGKVYFKSEEGKGTTFTMEIPVK